jgi:putative oxidoreductase
MTAITTAPSRTAVRVIGALRILMALAFVMASATKFGRNSDAVHSFHVIGLGEWFMYAIATLELAGAIGLLVRRLAGLAALGLSALLVGATLTQLVLFAPATALVPLAFLVPVAAIAWARRADTVRLLRRTA